VRSVSKYDCIIKNLSNETILTQILDKAEGLETQEELFNYTHQHIHIYIYIYYLGSLEFTLTHLKRSYMFRSHDHPHGAYIVPCSSYNLKHSVNH